MPNSSKRISRSFTLKMGSEGVSKADLFKILITRFCSYKTTQVCFISGTPGDVAVKERRIYHRIVQAFQTTFGKEKLGSSIYYSNKFGSPHVKYGLSNPIQIFIKNNAKKNCLLNLFNLLVVNINR